VLVLADVRLYREGLADVLDRSGAVDAVCACAELLEAVEQLERRSVDIALVGLSAGRTLAACAALARACLGTRVVALAVDRTDDIVAIVEAGVAGYVPKEASVADLVSTLESVSRGEMPCSPRVAGGLRRRIAELAPDVGQVKQMPLTVRERQVLALVAHDLSNKEIAQRLSIEVTTVKNHVHNMLEKLQVPTRHDAVALVHRQRDRSRWSPEAGNTSASMW
jgi:DNA-binding NarL/FixJ family response regulator